MVVSHLSELVEWLDCLYDITSFHKQANQLKQVKWALAASWSFCTQSILYVIANYINYEVYVL